MLGVNTKEYKIPTGNYKAGDEVIVEYRQTIPLMPERYAFSFGCTKYNKDGELDVFDRKYDSIIIEIVSNERGSLGLLDLKTKFEIKKKQ